MPGTCLPVLAASSTIPSKEMMGNSGEVTAAADDISGQGHGDSGGMEGLFDGTLSIAHGKNTYL